MKIVGRRLNIIMLRLTIVVLLNGGIFMTKYKRRNKSGLTTRKNYKSGKRA